MQSVNEKHKRLGALLKEAYSIASSIYTDTENGNIRVNSESKLSHRMLRHLTRSAVKRLLNVRSNFDDIVHETVEHCSEHDAESNPVSHIYY